MHILFLTPQVPYPPRQGTSIRNYNLLTRLAQRHTVDLLTFVAPGESLPPDSPLVQHCRRIASVPQPARPIRTRLRDLLTSPLPDMALRLESLAMHAYVQAWLRDNHYDIVQFEGIEMAQYALHVAADKTATVFDDHNCEYLLQQRNAMTDLRHPLRWHAAAYSVVQWSKLRRYEAQVCNNASAVVAVSQPDKAALHRIAPNATIHVAPNGIELATYKRSTHQVKGSPASSNPFTLLFTGKMDYRPNIDAVLWFANEVLPRVVAAEPNVRFQIVGMNPHARLDPLRHNPHIEITGMVTDPVPYLHAADVFVIPMRVGGGTRFKALEAMAAAKAIVSTSLGVEGIGVEANRDLIIADSPDVFAAEILRLFADQRAAAELTRQLGENAYRFVSAHYTWEHIMPVFDLLYAQLQSSHTFLQPAPARATIEQSAP